MIVTKMGPLENSAIQKMVYVHVKLVFMVTNVKKVKLLVYYQILRFSLIAELVT